MSERRKPFCEAEFVDGFAARLDGNDHEGALDFLIAELPALLASGMNRKEKLNHILFPAQALQAGGGTKHGSAKLLRKASTVAEAVADAEVRQRGLFVDFGAGVHDPIALATYFYLNGFQRAVANDLSPPRSARYSAQSMATILTEMAADPERFLMAGADEGVFRARLREFDVAAFRAGDFAAGFAGTQGRVRHVVGDIVNADIEPGEASVIVSFAVFEHVSDVDGVLRFLYERTAPGGLGYHFIDLADHRAYRNDGAYDAFTFLTEEEGPRNLNRLRRGEHISAFERAGFSILAQSARHRPVSAPTRERLLAPWKDLPEDELSAISLTLSVRKPADPAPRPVDGAATAALGAEGPFDVLAHARARARLEGETDPLPAKGLVRSSLGDALRQYRVPLSESARAHPTMMSLTEREVLFGLARDSYEGYGRIVDAGIFLGASTRLFAEGIAANGQRDAILARYQRPCISFEQGRLNRGMPAFFERHGVDASDLTGSSFVPLLERLIADVRPYVDLRIGDITGQTWSDGPIEILFLDLVKNPKINQTCLCEFYPHLIPGRSIVIQQDYFIDRLPFLKVSQEALSPYFEYLGSAYSSGYFRLTREIPRDVLEEAGAGDVPLKGQLAAIEECAARVAFDPDRHFMVLLSKVIATAAAEGHDAARAAYHELEGRFPDQAVLRTRLGHRMERALGDLNRDFSAAHGRNPAT
ncbi:MAG: methyltransferase domain-containing protein [Pseudomonadota bacterium]